MPKDHAKRLFNKMLNSSSLQSATIPLCTVGTQLATAEFLLINRSGCWGAARLSTCPLPKRSQSFQGYQSLQAAPSHWGSPRSLTGCWERCICGSLGTSLWRNPSSTAKPCNLLSPLSKLCLQPPFSSTQSSLCYKVCDQEPSQLKDLPCKSSLQILSVTIGFFFNFF